MTELRDKKSTIVRLMALLERVSPALGGRIAERLWFTVPTGRPPKHARPSVRAVRAADGGGPGGRRTLGRRAGRLSGAWLGRPAHGPGRPGKSAGRGRAQRGLVRRAEPWRLRRRSVRPQSGHAPGDGRGAGRGARRPGAGERGGGPLARRDGHHPGGRGRAEPGPARTGGAGDPHGAVHVRVRQPVRLRGADQGPVGAADRAAVRDPYLVLHGVRAARSDGRAAAATARPRPRRRRDTVDRKRGPGRRWPGASLVSTSGLGHRRVLRDPATIAAMLAFVAGPVESAAGEATHNTPGPKSCLWHQKTPP